MQAHLGDLIGTTVQYMTMDSWEAGMQNWTDDMIAGVPETARVRSDALSAGAGGARGGEART